MIKKNNKLEIQFDEDLLNIIKKHETNKSFDDYYSEYSKFYFKYIAP